MNVKFYKKILSEEQISNLKASEIREFEKQEEAIMSLAIAYLLSMFVLFVLLAAMILWFNKFTIFLVVIALPPTIMFIFSYFKTASKYKKKLKEFERKGE